MSIILSDSCAEYNTVSIGKKWDYSSTSGITTINNGSRYGEPCLVTSNSVTHFGKRIDIANDSNRTFFFSVLIKPTTIADRTLFSIGNTQNAICYIKTKTNGQLELNTYYNGQHLATSTSNILLNIWQRLDISFKATSVGGFFIVRLNGNEIINYPGNIMNNAASNTAWIQEGVSRMTFYPPRYTFIDDIMIWDDVDNNTIDSFIPDFHIHHLLPKQDATPNEWSGNLPHFNNMPVTTDELNKNEFFNFDNLSGYNPPQIHAVAVNTIVRSTKNINQDIRMKLMDNLNNLMVGEKHRICGTHTIKQQHFGNNFNNNPWKKTDFDNISGGFGIE